MREYVISVVACAVLVALGGMICHGGATSGAAKSCASLVLLYTVTVPLISALPDLDSFDLNSYLDGIRVEVDEEDSSYYEGVRDAFAEGVEKMVCEKFSLDGEEVRVVVFEFDLQKMNAEKIKIILSGSSASANSRGIVAAVEEAGLGKCEVELELSG